MTLIRSAILATAIISQINSGAVLASENNVITVDNSPIIKQDYGIVADIVGFRPIADLDVNSANNINRIRISQSLIIKSALKFQEVRNEISKSGRTPDSLNIGEIKKLVVSSGYLKNNLYNFSDIKNVKLGAPEGVVVHSDLATDPAHKKWDASVILNMLATGVLEIQEADYDNGGKKEYAKFDDRFVQEVIRIYASLPTIDKKEVQDIPIALQDLKDGVKHYSELEQSLLQKIGDITFGFPIIYSAEEKGLEIPDSLNRNFDVYFVELSATFRDLSAGDLSEMAINFALPDGSLAIELVPLRFGIDVKKKNENKSPSVSVELGGAKVSLGEFFRKNIEFSYLKPVISAFGLRENRFSWTLQEEAIVAGSHKFIAIIGVPKGSTSIDLAMSAHVRLVKAAYAFGGFIAGSETKYIRVGL